MIGGKEVALMLKANPESFIPFTRTRKKSSLFQRLSRSQPTETSDSKITALKSPIKKLAKDEQEGELNLLENSLYFEKIILLPASEFGAIAIIVLLNF